MGTRYKIVRGNAGGSHTWEEIWAPFLSAQQERRWRPSLVSNPGATHPHPTACFGAGRNPVQLYAVMEKAAWLQAASRRASFGQDTTQLRQRPDTTKRWRAEYAADDAARAAGTAAVMAFQAEWPLATLKLDELQQRHVRALEAALEVLPMCKHFQLKERLARTRVAAAARAGMQLLYRPERAVVDCRDFISYVHGLPHGTRVKVTKKPRPQPWPVGSVRGVCRAPRRSLERLLLHALTVCARWRQTRHSLRRHTSCT